MEQYVVKTGSSEKSQPYISKASFGYFYTQKAFVFDSKKEADAAISWGKKDVAKHIKNLTKDISKYEKEVAKGNLAINKVMLIKSKEALAIWKKMKLKAVKL